MSDSVFNLRDSQIEGVVKVILDVKMFGEKGPMRDKKTSKIFGPFIGCGLTQLVKLLIVISEVNHLVEFFCILVPKEIERIKLLSIFFEFRVLDFRRDIINVFFAFLQLLFRPASLNKYMSLTRGFTSGLYSLVMILLGGKDTFLLSTDC